MVCSPGGARTREDVQQIMDDFEIEVSDLWDDDPPDWDTRDGDMDGDGARQTTETIGGRSAHWRPAHSPLTPRLTTRGKLTRGAVAVVAVLLASAFLITTSAPVRRELGSVVAGSPFAKKAASGTETLYFENGVPWGTLWLDGHRTRQSASQPLGSIRAGKGHHTLRYSDPPFPTLQCHFDVPMTMSDTCPLALEPTASAVASGAYVRIVNLGATPGQMPLGSYQQLISVTNEALHGLSSSTLLLPGSTYLDGQGVPEVATRPLMATLHFDLNTDPSVVAPYVPGQQLCSQICFLSDDARSPGAWGLQAVTQVSWSYATPDGSVVVANAPAANLSDGSRTLVALDVTWDGSWHVVARPDADRFAASPLCDVAQALMPPVSPAHGIELPYTQRQLPAVNTADGCLIVTQITKPPDYGHPAYVLYRFGVLLAANSQAHALFPSLPNAGAYEQGLVRQMVGPGGFG